MEHLINLITLVGFFGYAILFLIIFLESFPPTFFLPGDSLLIITGFLASQGHFNIVLLIATLLLASITGYMFSYAMGGKLRNLILNSNDKYWFKKHQLEYTENFYHKHGSKTIIIGRFIPIVRSFSPTLAGAVHMNYSKFFYLSLLGGFLWVFGLTFGSYYFGGKIPYADKFFTPILIIIVVVTFLPSIVEAIRRFLVKKA